MNKVCVPYLLILLCIFIYTGTPASLFSMLRKSCVIFFSKHLARANAAASPWPHIPWRSGGSATSSGGRVGDGVCAVALSVEERGRWTGPLLAPAVPGRSTDHGGAVPLLEGERRKR